MRLPHQCAECGRPADITMLCPVCRMLPEYGGLARPIEDDECTCPACRSDVAGLVPCVKESRDGR